MKAIRGGKHSEKSKDQSKVKKMDNEAEPDTTQYAELLLQFIQPTLPSEPELEELEGKLQVGVMAWNLAVIKQKDESFYTVFNKNILAEMDFDKNTVQFLNMLIKEKEEKFATYDVMFIDCEIEPNNHGEARINVTTKTYDQYVQDLLSGNMDDIEEDDEEEEEGEWYDSLENYLNRSAVAVIPKTPFLTWVQKTYLPGKAPEGMGQLNTTYLINTLDENSEIEKWLKKNFDQVFQNELSNWSEDESEWPKNRTYKLFTEWFEVKICSMVYDFGTLPMRRS